VKFQSSTSNTQRSVQCPISSLEVTEDCDRTKQVLMKTTNSPATLRNETSTRLRARGERRNRGFTLVEMLLVLVILATLAAIVYPKVAGRSEQARVTAAQTQIANFANALGAFEVDNGYYPKGKNGLMDLVQKPKDAVNWHAYLDSVPKDPWGQDYQYECPGKHNPNSFDIYSPGPPNKDMVIGNWKVAN
jgi:general secretion pathway protein G